MMTTYDLIRLFCVVVAILAIALVLWLAPCCRAADPFAAVRYDPFAGVAYQGATATVPVQAIVHAAGGSAGPGPAAPSRPALAWVRVGREEPILEPCASCPSGYRLTGQTARWYLRSDNRAWAQEVATDSGVVGRWITEGDQRTWEPAAEPKQPAPPSRSVDADPGSQGAGRAFFRAAGG